MLKISNVLLTSKLMKEPSVWLRKFSSTKTGCQKKAAVVLSGSGMLDGTEIHEAAAVAVHLTRLSMEPVFYAPQCPQDDVIDHTKGCPMRESRCAITESARIARGLISPLQELQHCCAEVVIFPGGFGVTKTLSTYATDGAACAINDHVMRIMHEFHDAKKPMAFTSISAILPARCFPCVKVTLGKKGDERKWPHSKAIDCAIQMGAEVEMRDVDGFSFDKQHLIFSTPAYMYEGSFHQIFNGIGNVIEHMYQIMD